MRTIKKHQVESVKAENVKAGMIIAEGIILEVDRQGMLGRPIIWMYTACASVWSEAGRGVQVFGRVNHEMVEAIAKTYSRNRD